MIEPQLVVLLGALVGGRVFPDVAPEGTELPYCLYEQIGGKPLNFLTPDVPDKKNALIQVSVWSKTRAEAMMLIRSIEDTLILEPFFAEVASGPRSAFDQETSERGAMQDFSIWG